MIDGHMTAARDAKFWLAFAPLCRWQRNGGAMIMRRLLTNLPKQDWIAIGIDLSATRVPEYRRVGSRAEAEQPLMLLTGEP